MASFDAIISAWSSYENLPMRTTVALDDDLVRLAREFTGVGEKTALIREALKALIERESARRLASLGGTMPELKNIPRRKVRPNKLRSSRVRAN
jgi:Arc/MetJ family transcription regulator